MGSGEDWLIGDVGAPKESKKVKLVPATGIVVTPDEIDAVLADTARAGKRLANGLKGAVAGLEAVRTSGLTGEALVVLVTEKCGRSGGNRVTQTTVQVVLEALFNRLGEYVRG